jgi:acetyltransferase-like isoleucine patch superfamily enzyme
MTLLSLLLSWFPALVISSALASLLWLFCSFSLWGVFALIFSLYGLPLLAYRIHQHFYPVEEGVSYLIGNDYSPWWGSHQFQVIYIALPFLESLLRLIPGLFSAWLRLWGAKIGENVYWTPQLEIADRGLIEIGDRAILGHHIQLYSHVIKPKHQNLMLYVKKIKIGNNVFLGAGSRLAPGTVVENNKYIPILTDIYPNRKASLSNLSPESQT